MKIWVTYDSASGLHAGGLERCSVWFTKPEYYFIKNTRDWEDENLPFGDEDEQRRGVQRWGWMSNENTRGETSHVSFGKVFGYGEGFPKQVWRKLEKHFGSNNLREWSDIEKTGRALAENFILEVEVSATFKIL